MIWSLALCPDDTKQDLVVYGAEFGVVFLAKSSRTASIQVPPDAHPACAGPSGDFNGHVRDFG